MVMRVLVGCEFSGVVRDAFAALGHDAWSCDFEPSETPGNHIQDDILNVGFRGHWDLLIAHPPCTDLAASGRAWFHKKGSKLDESVEFVKQIWDLPIHRVAIENPIGILSTRWRKPNQIIEPWWFGHDTTKATCLWLRNLPNLRATNPVLTFNSSLHKLPASKERSKIRSKTYEGVAKAMAQQWSTVL